MKRLTLVSTDLQCFYKWQLKSHSPFQLEFKGDPRKGVLSIF